jgi:hypothetical protein
MVLPGISAEACLFADLLIDPGTCGYQSFEATDFLIRQRQFDPSSHLILWQADVIGRLDNPQTHDNSNGIKLLVDYLQRQYSLSHELIIYEAAQYPSFAPKIEKILLGQLQKACLSRISTLYFPPASRTLNHEITLKLLNMHG